jgi:chaperonin GroEL
MGWRRHDDCDRFGAQAIVREGMKSVAAGMNPMDLEARHRSGQRVVADLKARVRSRCPLERIAQVTG